VPAEIKVMIAVEASVDVELKLALIPPLWDVNISDNFFFLFVIFVNFKVKIILKRNLVQTKICFLLLVILLSNAYSLAQ